MTPEEFMQFIQSLNQQQQEFNNLVGVLNNMQGLVSILTAQQAASVINPTKALLTECVGDIQTLLAGE